MIAEGDRLAANLFAIAYMAEANREQRIDGPPLAPREELDPAELARLWRGAGNRCREGWRAVAARWSGSRG